MAKAKAIDTIVDAARSWGQIDFRVSELEADFVGFNLHKWIGAPLGVGGARYRKAPCAAGLPQELATMEGRYTRHPRLASWLEKIGGQKELA